MSINFLGNKFRIFIVLICVVSFILITLIYGELKENNANIECYKNFNISPKLNYSEVDVWDYQPNIPEPNAATRKG